MNSLEKKFWDKVSKTSTCWLWTGAKVPYGYGQFAKGYAHRYSYKLHKGEIPIGLCILHKCDVPSCVNPEHLLLGTQKNNMEDKVSKGRQNRGEERPLSKLTEKEILEIRSRNTYRGCRIVWAKEFKVSAELIRRIINKEIWKHI